MLRSVDGWLDFNEVINLLWLLLRTMFLMYYDFLWLLELCHQLMFTLVNLCFNLLLLLFLLLLLLLFVLWIR